MDIIYCFGVLLVFGCIAIILGAYLHWRVINKQLSDDERNDEDIRMEDMQ